MPDTQERLASTPRATALQKGSAKVTKRIFGSWPTWLALLVLIGILQLANFILPPYLVPDVAATLTAVGSIVVNEPMTALVTLARFAIALGAAMLCGWLFGLAMTLWPILGRLLKPYFSIILATPALSLILLAILWVREIELRIFLVVFIIAIPFYVINTYEGLRAVDSDVARAVDQFRPKKWQRAAYLLVPHSVSFLIMTTRTVSGFTMRMLVFAELIGASTGIGTALNLAQSNFRVDVIIAWTIILVAINFAILGLVSLWERTALRWRADVAASRND